MALPRDLNFDNDTRREIMALIHERPALLMNIPEVLTILSTARRARVKDSDIRVYEGYSRDAVLDHTVPHNLAQLKRGEAEQRPILMSMALRMVDAVRRGAGTARVLCIGPRSEAEIFALLTVGFRADNIHAVDLISYSDYVTPGDMHALPYAADSFDVVVAGWVLAYSANNAAVAAEIARVARPGAYVAVGCNGEPPAEAPDVARAAYGAAGGVLCASKGADGRVNRVVSRYFAVEQLHRLFAPYTASVIVSHGREPGMDDERVNLFAVYRLK